MADFNIAVTEILASVKSFGEGPEASARFAEFAAGCRDDVIAQDHPSNVVQFVNGKQGAPLSDVTVPGTVVFEFAYAAEIVQAILNELVSKSPYREKRPDANPSTHYRDEHAIAVDGVEVSDPPTELRPGQVVTLYNLQPYSRKIEHGLSLQAPSGVYEVVAGWAKDRFDNVADISFGYDVFPGQGPQGPAFHGERRHFDAAGRHTHSTVRKDRHADDKFPTITIKARE